MRQARTYPKRNVSGEGARQILVTLSAPTILRRLVPLLITAVALLAAATRIDATEIARTALGLPGMALVIVCAALLCGTLLASLRLQLIAWDLKRRMQFGDAMTATTAGALGGALFFSIFGQVWARSAVLSKSGVSPAATIILTVCPFARRHRGWRGRGDLAAVDGR